MQATADEVSEVIGSPQQEAFWAEIADGDSHILLEARAGTGKSFSAREGMRRLPAGTRSIYCAFNRHIADEFGRGLPYGAKAATMHSLGFAAIRKAVPKVEVDDRKVSRIIALRDDAPKGEARQALSRLVSLAKGEALDGSEVARLRELAARHDVDATDEVLGLVRPVLVECAARPETIDYDDMVWLPVARRDLVSPREAEVLFVDEAQDLNLCQQKLAGRLCPRGRIVVIGDRFQSIYGFRGADAESIPNMERALGSTRRGLASLPLTVTRRCPRRVVELARRIVPDLEPMDGAIDGVVATAAEERAVARMAPGDMVLCRVNAPLVSLAFRLIRAGRRAEIRGRDMSKGLVQLAEKVGGATIVELIGRVRQYQEAESARLKAADARPSALVDLDDRCECLIAVASECDAVSQIGPRLAAIFSDGGGDGAVLLSSIHRAKGLEADTVYVLRPQVLPHPKAESGWEFRQELNLAYVAATRARRELVFLGDVPGVFGGRA